MRHLRPEDYRLMAWKNGGGTTTEIAIHPEDSGLSGCPFIWRLSIADVGSDGPFSRFPGYDRQIMVISGKGMMLDAAAEGEIDLSQPLVVRHFSGDWEITGRLISGPVRDFNLMVARDHAAGTLAIERIDGRRRFAAEGESLVLHVLEGDGVAEGRVIGEGDTLILDAGEWVTLTPGGEFLLLAIAGIAWK